MAGTGLRDTCGSWFSPLPGLLTGSGYFISAIYFNYDTGWCLQQPGIQIILIAEDCKNLLRGTDPGLYWGFDPSIRYVNTKRSSTESIGYRFGGAMFPVR